MECMVNLIICIVIIIGWITCNFLLAMMSSKEKKYEPINIRYEISDSLHDIRCRKNTKKNIKCIIACIFFAPAITVLNAVSNQHTK